MELVVDGLRVELGPADISRAGLLLLSLAERGTIRIESSCRSASCGTCLVAVESGGEHLSPMGRAERDLVELLVDVGEHRLACQARVVTAGPGRCVLRTA